MSGGRRHRAGRSGWTAVVVAAVSLSVPACRPHGPAQLAAVPALSPTRRELTCASGLRVIAETTPAAHFATVTLMVGAGASMDPVGREGLAHLVEHLSFRASEAGQLRRGIDLNAIGVQEDGATDPDAVVFKEIGPTGSLAVMLEAEAARLANPTTAVDEATFQVERNVVRNELRQTQETDVKGYTQLVTLQALFPAPHPYHRSVIGTLETLSSISLAETRRWASATYQPARATILLTGAVDQPGLESLVLGHVPRDLCGGFVPGAPRRTLADSATPAGQGGAPLVRFPAEVPAPELWIAWRVPGFLDGTSSTTDVWTALLVQNVKASHLADPDVATVRCSEDPGVYGTVIACRLALVRAVDAEATTKRFTDAVARVAADLPRLLPKARHKLKLIGAYTDETPWERARTVASVVHQGGTLALGERVTDGWQSVSVADLEAFHRRFLAPRMERALLALPAPPPPARADAGSHDVPTRAPRLRWPTRPKYALDDLARLHFLDGLETATLPNGLVVVTVPRKNAHIMTAKLGVRVALEDSAASLAASDALKTVLDEPPADLGVDFDRGFGDTGAALTAFGAADELDRAIAMLARAAREYRIEWPSSTFLGETFHLRRRFEASPSVQGTRLFMSTIFAGHPFAHQISAAEIGAQPRERIEAFASHSFAPNNAALVVVGDVRPAQVLASAQRAFGDWRPSSRVVELTPAAQPGAGAITRAAWPGRPSIVERPGATQAEIIQGCLLPPSNPQTDAMYDVVAELIGGELGSHLRQELGASYGVEGHAYSREGGSAYMILKTAIGNDELRLTVTALRRFWDELRDGEFNLDDLSEEKMARVRYRTFRFEHSDDLADELLTEWMMKWPLTTIDDYASYVVAVRGADARALLRGCARHLTVTIAGDPAAIAGALAP